MEHNNGSRRCIICITVLASFISVAPWTAHAFGYPTMPPQASVTVEDAVAAIKTFPCVLNGDNFPPYSSDVWNDVSKMLNGKWTPNDAYHSIKYNRRNIVTLARKELGLQSIVEEADTSEVIENGQVSSKDDDDEYTWFDLVLSREEWDTIKPTDIVSSRSGDSKDAKLAANTRKQKLKPGVWTNIIANAFSKQTKLPCAFVFKQAYVSKSKNAKNYLSINGHCKLKNCANVFAAFLEKIPKDNEGCTIKVKSRDTREVDHDQVKRPLNGQLRKAVQEKLCAEGCSNWQKRKARENMEIGDEEPPFIYHADVLRQAKKEKIDCDIGVDPLDRRDLIRAIEDISARPEFQGVVSAVASSPFYTIYSTMNQMHVYKKYAQIMKSKTTIAIDATGSLVRKVKLPNGKSTGHIFLYSIVINFAKKTVPVFQMLSETHVTEFIEFFLKQWLRRGAPRPRETICDYSKALLSGLCLAFNNETIKSYVNNIFLNLNEGLPITDKTRIRVDVAHLIHLVSRWKCFTNCAHTEVKEFYIRCVARMIEVTTVIEFDRILTLTCAVASQKYADSELELSSAQTVVEARMHLENLIASPINSKTEVDRSESCHVRPNIVEELEFEHFDEAGSLEKNSIQKWVGARILKAAGTLCVGSDINAFFLPDFIIPITRLAKEFPLWTAVTNSHTSTRASSACIESYFNDLKSNVLRKKMYRADAFMMIHIRDIDGGSMVFGSKLTEFERQAKRREEDVMLENKTNEEIDKPFDDSDLMSVENWRGKALNNNCCHLEYSFRKDDENFDGNESEFHYMAEVSLKHHSYSKPEECNDDFGEGEIGDDSTRKQHALNDEDNLSIPTQYNLPNHSLYGEVNGSNIVTSSPIPDITVTVEESMPDQVTTTDSKIINRYRKIDDIFACTPAESDAVSEKIEISNQKSKYFRQFPEVRQINSRIAMNTHRPKHACFLQNGNCLTAPVNIQGEPYFVRNTCPFDSFVHLLITAAIDDLSYATKINESENTTLQFISRLVKTGVTKKTYEERATLLKCYYLVKPAANIDNRIKTFIINAWDSITHTVQQTIQKSVPSRRKVESCTHCSGREFIDTILTVNANIIRKEGFNSLEKALDLRPCIFKVKCPNDCPGTCTILNYLGLHLFVDLDVRKIAKLTESLRCKLRHLPEKLKFGTENGNHNEYRLVGVVAYTVKHFISYRLRISGVWQLYDDLKTKIMPCGVDTEIIPQLAVYVRLTDLP